MQPPTLGCLGRRPRAHAVALVALAAVSLAPGRAEARRTGIISSDCTGCHTSTGASVEITASPATFAPGDDVTFTVAVRREQGTAAVGGVSIGEPATGALHTLSGEGLTLVAGSGLTHSQPKAAVGGVVTFRFGWRAPAEPGGISFAVAALAGNGDGRSSGDVAGFERYLATFGCEPEILYADLDHDGHGTELFGTDIGCAGAPVPLGLSPLSDDCNENDPAVFPTAVEKCNKRDDDCDGEIDEDAVLVELWPDEDGDGYFAVPTGTAVVGCAGLTGYASEPGDCGLNDAAVNPGATEVCNLIDDNCDGRIDERLRPQCGEGFCRRESYDCDPAHCTPGEPKPERCNYLDDDCNGEVDEGDDLCAPGSACLAGKCVVTEGAAGASGAAGGAAAGAGGALASSGGSAGAAAGGSAGAPSDGGAGLASAGTGGSTGGVGTGATGGRGGPRDGATSGASAESSSCTVGAPGSPRRPLHGFLLALGAALFVARRRFALRASRVAAAKRDRRRR